MQTLMKVIILATALIGSSVAFANSTVAVNVPFDFVVNARNYPAGKYVVTLDPNQNVLALNSYSDPKISARYLALPADFRSDEPALSLKFDDIDGLHRLHTIRLGTRTTPLLDKREIHAPQSYISIASNH